MYRDRKEAPTEFDLNTGDKTPELALFYNIAYERTERYRQSVAGTAGGQLTEKAYIILKGSFWKGYSDDKNKSGTVVTEHEKKIIDSILVKLKDVRNFQSHYYHKVDALIFDSHLTKHIQAKFNQEFEKCTMGDAKGAKLLSNALNPKLDKGEIPTLFDKHGDHFYINKIGKCFFLSYFLTTGEMHLLLQQRKGFKRSDSDFFKRTHQLFTALCHRDGAARYHYNQKDTFFETNTELPDDILQARQVYKISSYLNDLPLEWFDEKLFFIPGYDSQGVLNLPKLQNWLVDKNIPTCILQDLAWVTRPQAAIVSDDLNGKRKEPATAQLEKRLGFTCHGHKITLNPHAFKRLIMLCMHDQTKGIELQSLLSRFVGERKALLVMVRDNQLPIDVEPKDGYSWLQEYNKFKLRTDSDRLREKLDRFVEQYGSDKKRQVNKLALIEGLEEQPIDLKFADLFDGLDYKPRRQDEFVKYSVRYLVDKNVIPQMNFMWQSFEHITNRQGTQVLTEINCFQPTKPKRGMDSLADWRLKLTPDNQVLFSWGVTTDPIKPGDGKNTNENLPLYIMGEHVLKNLLIAHLRYKDKDDKINRFFTDLTEDLDTVYKGGERIFKVLEESYLPTSLVPEKRNKADSAVKERMTKRLAFLINEYQNLLKNPPRLRSARNTVILKAYLLFGGWPTRGNGTAIHLRKEDMKLISIVHYNRGEKYFSDASNLKLVRGKVPSEIFSLIDTSKSFDDLYKNILDSTLSILENWLGNTQTKGIKLSKLIDFGKSIGVTSYIKVSMPRRLPFAVHPEHFLKNIFIEQAISTKKSDVNKKIRESAAGLKMQNYLSLTQHCEMSQLEDSNTLRRKRIGVFDTLKLKDQILFLIAKKYDPNFTTVIGQSGHEIVFKPLPDSKPATISWIHIKHNLQKENLGVFQFYDKTFVIKVKFHQLDDNMVLLRKEELRKLICHYLLDSGLFVSALPSSANVGQQKFSNRFGQVFKFSADFEIILKQLDLKKGEDGQTLIDIPFEQIKRTKQSIYLNSLIAVDTFLQFEADEIKRQGLSKNEKGYIDPEAIIRGSVHNSFLADLKAFRDTCMHARIPEHYTYRSLADESSLFPLKTEMAKLFRIFDQKKEDILAKVQAVKKLG